MPPVKKNGKSLAIHQIQMSFLKECQVIVPSNSTNLPEDLHFQPIQGVILLLFESPTSRTGDG
jgi:hypothetical protein